MKDSLEGYTTLGFGSFVSACQRDVRVVGTTKPERREKILSPKCDKLIERSGTRPTESAEGRTALQNTGLYRECQSMCEPSTFARFPSHDERTWNINKNLISRKTSGTVHLGFIVFSWPHPHRK
jgi:hypothetical protein